MKNLLLKKLEEIGAIQRGDFLLKNGEHSDIYFDIKKAYGNPGIFKEIIADMVKLIPKETTCIAGSGHGGIPLATALSLELNKNVSMVRDAPKGHGIGKMIDGYQPNKNDEVVIVDDVLTSGTSLRTTIQNLGDSKILKCVVILKRGEAEGIDCDIVSVIDTRDR
jgi:orotate phosphoribosyltransferase